MDLKSVFRKTLEDAEAAYFSELVEENIGHSRQLFQAINKIMHRRKLNPMPDYTDPCLLATEFSEFFTSKIAKIRQAFPDVNIQESFKYDAIKPILTELSNFEPMSVSDVSNLIKSSKSKCCELDPIPTSLLKDCTDILAPIITEIMNLSIKTSTFPDIYKTAIVKPLLKKKNLSRELKNYRPVSNLSYISKLLECVINKQLQQHLKTHDLPEPLQSAYKPHHSTETALVKVFNDILCAIDGPNAAVFMAMLDLSAAFDTVDHDIMHRRLQNTLGITGTALEWFRSYLDKRSMKVSINGSYSEAVRLDVSVPQGSQIAPELYNNYTQPLGHLLRSIGMMYHCYADDTQLMKTVSLKEPANQHDACRMMSDGIKTIEDWMTANKLKLNPEKTEFIVISNSRNFAKVAVDQLQLNNAQVKRVDCVRNLGVTMDSTLTMKEHVAKLCQTCYYYISWVKRIRHILNQHTAKLIIQALVLSRLDYCNVLFLGMPDNIIKKLQRVMNTAARVITQTTRSSSITAALKELHWLPVKQRIQFKTALLVYKSLHGLTPSYISDMLQTHTPARSLRSSKSNLLTVRKSRTSYGDRAFSVAAPKLWNSLPDSIKQSSTLNCFRKNLKTHLFKQAYFS